MLLYVLIIQKMNYLIFRKTDKLKKLGDATMCVNRKKIIGRGIVNSLILNSNPILGIGKTKKKQN